MLGCGQVLDQAPEVFEADAFSIFQTHLLQHFSKMIRLEVKKESGNPQSKCAPFYFYFAFEQLHFIALMWLLVCLHCFVINIILSPYPTPLVL